MTKEDVLEMVNHPLSVEDFHIIDRFMADLEGTPEEVAEFYLKVLPSHIIEANVINYDKSNVGNEGAFCTKYDTEIAIVEANIENAISKAAEQYGIKYDIKG